MLKNYVLAALLVILTFSLHAQDVDSIGSHLAHRVDVAPNSVFTMFRNAGMDPTNHALSAVERTKVENAFAHLPPLHRRILAKHLRSISFMDNMPNTALTSPIESKDSTKIFNITFRAGILTETISDWATKKENVCYSQSNKQGFEVIIEAGNLDAFLYVLLHEATHVVDAVLELTPHPSDREAIVEHTSYTKNTWQKMNKPEIVFVDSLLEKTLFRGGSAVDISLAPEIYRRIHNTPFASLYSMASWFEDLAELESIYHLTNKMKQPFCVRVKQNNITLVTYEPMKNKRVRNRIKQLNIFYLST